MSLRSNLVRCSERPLRSKCLTNVEFDLKLDPEGDGLPPDCSTEIISNAGVELFTYLKQVGSTNSYALQQLATRNVNGAWLVLAELQTAGRGRGENRWWSEGGALTFSLVVDAEHLALPQSHWPRLSMAIGLAICQLLEQPPWGLPMQLKWPNDIYVGGRKLGGILVEHLGSKLVIGIGLNVNSQLDRAPQDVQMRATSLRVEMKAECCAASLLIDTVKAVLATLPQVAREEIDFAHEAGQRSYLQWKRVAIQQGQLKTEGICAGIDGDGALLVRTDSGLMRVLSGTVEIAGK